MEYLIDGYNLLHAWTPLAGAAPKEAIFERLASFASSSRQSMTVVLDGVGPDAEWLKFQTPFFRICYSQAVSADATIEKILCARSGKTFGVVTEDRAIAAMAKGTGACVFGVKDFLKMLESETRHNQDVLFKWKVKGHGFNRPFETKFKDTPDG